MTGRPSSATGEGTDGLSPAESLALIGAQDRATRRALAVNEWVLYATWGLAWLVANGITSLVYQDGSAGSGSVWLVNLIWPVAMGAALVVTMRHVSRRRAGVAGDGASGVLFGLAWLLSIAVAAGTGATVSGLVPAVDPALVRILPSVCIVLVIGTIYLLCGVLWGDRLQFVVGVWLVLVNAASLATGPDTYTLGMAVGGGGGFLVAALLAWQRERANESVAAG